MTPCASCPPGTFSGVDVCYPWTECSWEYPEVIPPSSSSDRVCGAYQDVRQFGTSSVDQAVDVAVDELGNVYVSGDTWGALDGPNQGNSDAFVRKYSPQGDLSWAYQGGSVGSDTGQHVALDGAGRLHVMVAQVGQTTLWMFDREGTLLSEQVQAAGYTVFAVDSQGERYLARPYVLTDGTIDIELTRLALDGSAVWSVILAGGAFDMPKALLVLPNHDIVLTGSTNGGLFRASSGHIEAFVARFSSDGSVVWGDQFAPSAEEIMPASIALDSLGNLFIAGVALPGTAYPQDVFVAKITPEHVIEWLSVHGTSEFDEYFDIAVNVFDQVVVVGDTNGEIAETNYGQVDVVVGNVTAAGYPNPVLLFGTAGHDVARGIAAAPDGAWFVVGFTEGSLDGWTNAGDSDAWVQRMIPF